MGFNRGMWSQRVVSIGCWPRWEVGRYSVSFSWRLQIFFLFSASPSDIDGTPLCPRADWQCLGVVQHCAGSAYCYSDVPP